MNIKDLVTAAGMNAYRKGQIKRQSYSKSLKDYYNHMKSELKEVKKAEKPWSGVNVTMTAYNPDSFESEIADLIIRTASYCHLMGIDLDKAIIEKLAYNETRKEGKEY